MAGAGVKDTLLTQAAAASHADDPIHAASRWLFTTSRPDPRRVPPAGSASEGAPVRNPKPRGELT